MTAYNVHKEVKIEAPMERVFEALTSSLEIPRYYPLESAQSDWHIGSEVVYRGTVDGVPFTDFGVIEQLSPPYLFHYRYWSDNHGTERSEENYVGMRYELEKSGDGTLLKLTQRNLPSAVLRELMDSQVWNYLLGSLKEYVERSQRGR